MKIKLIIMMAVTIFALLAPVSGWAFSCSDGTIRCYRKTSENGKNIMTFVGTAKVGRCYTKLVWLIGSCEPCGSSAGDRVLRVERACSGQFPGVPGGGSYSYSGFETHQKARKYGNLAYGPNVTFK